MADAGKAYVIPGGVGAMRGIFGPGYGSDNWPEPTRSIFDTGDGSGAYGAPTDAWNALRLGWGTLDAPEALQAGMLEARGRYMGGPNTAGWQERWDTWNNTDLTGPDGRTLFSPVHMTGLRVAQGGGSYGVERDSYGNLTDPWNSSMFEAARGVRNNLNQDPWLDPATAIQGLRTTITNSPYAAPNPDDYLSLMQQATGGPGAADFYGQRGVDQTNALADQNIRQLTRGIDREAEETLANQLPEIQHAMEAAGLGRSGAGQLQMLGAQKDILSQANRDKQRVMADYSDREANRRAQAINLGSQIGAQGYGQYAQQQGQAALAGLGDQFQMNQGARNNEQALWAAQMQNRYMKNQGDQDALFQMLGQAGQYNLGVLDQERLGQSASLADWLGLQANRNQTQADSLAQYMQLSDSYRGIEQERLNQMLQADMMPFDMMMRMATGISAPSSPAGSARPNFWAGLAGSAAGGIAGGVGNGIGNWLGGFGGGPVEGASPYVGI